MTVAEPGRNRLLRDIQALLNRIGTNSPVPPAELDELVKRVEIDALIRAEDELRARRWAVRVLIYGALLCGSIVLALSAIPISWFEKTAIDLLVTTDYINFSVPQDTSIIEGALSLDRLVVFSPTIKENGSCIKAARAGGRVFASGGPVEISFAEPVLLTGASASLERKPDRNYRFRITPVPGMTQQIVFKNRDGSNSPRSSAACDRDEVNLRSTQGKPIELEPYPAANVAIPFQRQFRVNNLKLYRDRSEKDRSTEHSEDHSEDLSGISSGTLYISTLLGKKYDLRRMELLDMKEVEGTILGLSGTSTGLNLRFTGRARGISLGNSPAVDITPTLLDWLQAHVRNFWTITASLMAVLVTLLQLSGVLSK